MVSLDKRSDYWKLLFSEVKLSGPYDSGIDNQKI